MTKRALRIGITASGGDLVPSAFMSLRKNRQLSFEIHAFNAAFAPLSARLADRFHILPSGEHPDFASKVMDYLNQSPLDVLMPWSDEEAMALSKTRNEISKMGCVVLTSPPDVLETITDKAKTYDLLKKEGLKVPEYSLAGTSEEVRRAVIAYGYPKRTVVVKPAKGRGGRGVKILLGEEGGSDWLGRGRREERLTGFDISDFEITENEAFLVMPCLNMPVYDVDIFRFDGCTDKCFVRERINPTGIPFAGNILKSDSRIEEYARNIAEVMKLQSLHDIDMMTDPVLGPVLLEINPRPSGSLAGLSSAGYPLLDYALAGAAGIPINLNDVKEDKEILTYTESLVLS